VSVKRNMWIVEAKKLIIISNIHMILIECMSGQNTVLVVKILGVQKTEENKRGCRH
jgi:hypothetical protein